MPGAPVLHRGKVAIHTNPWAYWLTQDRATTPPSGKIVLSHSPCNQGCECCHDCSVALVGTTPQWVTVGLTDWTVTSDPSVQLIAHGDPRTWPGGPGYPTFLIACDLGDLNASFDLPPYITLPGGLTVDPGAQTSEALHVANHNICRWRRSWECDGPFQVYVIDPNQDSANLESGGTIGYISLSEYLGTIDDIDTDSTTAEIALNAAITHYAIGTNGTDLRISTGWVVWWSMTWWYNPVHDGPNPTVYDATIAVAASETCSTPLAFVAGSGGAPPFSGERGSDATELASGSGGCPVIAANECEADTSSEIDLVGQNIPAGTTPVPATVPLPRIDGTLARTGVDVFGTLDNVDLYTGTELQPLNYYPALGDPTMGPHPIILFNGGAFALEPHTDFPDPGHFVDQLTTCDDGSGSHPSSSDSSGSSGGPETSGGSSSDTSTSSGGGSGGEPGSSGGGPTPEAPYLEALTCPGGDPSGHWFDYTGVSDGQTWRQPDGTTCYYADLSRDGSATAGGPLVDMTDPVDSCDDCDCSCDDPASLPSSVSIAVDEHGHGPCRGDSCTDGTNIGTLKQDVDLTSMQKSCSYSAQNDDGTQNVNTCINGKKIQGTEAESSIALFFDSEFCVWRLFISLVDGGDVVDYYEGTRHGLSNLLGTYTNVVTCITGSTATVS